MRWDPGQVALTIFVHRPPGIVWAEQLILVPVSLFCQDLWGQKGQVNELLMELQAVLSSTH
jgi:hypothetical protein